MKTGKYLAFYLFASPTSELDQSPKNVFYKAETELLAESLCRLFKREYTYEDGRPTFHFIPSTSISAEEQVLLDEALDWLPLYRDPDPGLYDPPPSEHTLILAQYMIRASDWEERLRQRPENPSSSPTSGGYDSNRERDDRPEIGRNSHATGKTPGDSPEERRNSELYLFFLLAQVYYKMLECTVSMASWCTMLDLELNGYYLWTVEGITNLLKYSDNLKDFPVPFEPLFPDLYPATIRDWDWEDGLAPEIEEFLSTVQQYVLSKGIYEPEKGSAGWIFVELFRPSINAAIEKAVAYNKRMRQYVRQVLYPASPKAETATKEQETKGVAPAKEPVVEEKKKQSSEVHHNNYQSNVPYEISLLEEIADKLENWAEERKTNCEDKIEEARVSWKNQQASPMMEPLDSYFALPHLSDELNFIVKTFQSNNNSASADMLVEIQDELRHYDFDTWILTVDARRHFSSYDPGSDEYKSWVSSIRGFPAVTIPNIVKRIRKIAEMTKKKMTSGKLIKGSSALAEGPSKSIETERIIEANKELKAIHKALIKAMSKRLKEANNTEITRDALVRKTSYSVGSGAANQAYIDLKRWGIFTNDGQNFTPEFQHYNDNPPE